RIITIGVGILSLYLFPTDPSKTRIFNEEERALAMARIFHDQPAIREHNEKITWGLIKRGVVNINVVVGAWIYICDQITVQGLSIFTVTILRLNYPGRSTVEIQLLSVPPPIFGMIFGLGVAYITMKTRMHGVAIAVCASLNITGYSIWLASTNVQARYAAIFLNTAGGYSFGTLILSWTLANAAPDTVRNVANGAVSGLANIGSITATWSYINTDAKTGYRIGNSLNTATAASVIVASLGLAVHQNWENKKRAQGGRDYRLDASDDEIATLGHLHPNFRDRLVKDRLRSSLGIDYTRSWTTQQGYLIRGTVDDGYTGVVVSRPWTNRRYGRTFQGCVGNLRQTGTFMADSHEEGSYEGVSWVGGAITACIKRQSSIPLSRCQGSGNFR
ncbi:putative major facilitator superfamily transporter, partial [Colletotrichum sublineola]